MFLDINKIGPEGEAVDQALEPVDLEGATGESIPCTGVRIRGEAVRGSRGVRLRADLTGTVRLRCSRCLEDFERPVATKVFLILVPEAVEFGSGGESEIRDEDVALYYTREGRADLTEIATEQLYLELPLKPICREGCRGLCPGCGANRNLGSCSCRTDNVDPRLAALFRLKKD